MRRKESIFLAVIIMAMAVSSAHSQDEKAVSAAKDAAGTVVQAVKPDAVQSQAKEMSIYGEVQAVNAAANSLNVQYYDYDNDDERTAEIVLNQDTKLENAAGISNIKQGDWVDVTYTSADSKNIAKSVIVEKEEEVNMADNAPMANVPSEEE